MKYNLIGAGRLGMNIAFALIQHRLLNLQAICNRSLHSAETACKSIGAGHAVNQIRQLPKADVFWITVNDDVIVDVVQELLSSSILEPGNRIIHCSGVLSSDILAPLKKYGCEIASVHPLKAFKSGYLDANCFDQVDCVIEGDVAIRDWLKELFYSLGANLIPITAAAKPVYHAAACMASNYLVTLAACSEELLINAGIPAAEARVMIGKLMQGNLNNLLTTQNISQALTGPLKRGDSKTIALHLDAIADPLINNLYRAAGLATLPLTLLEDEKLALLVKLLKT
ncbi:MAG: DUF2520 domain-containing protein [Legionella sp.]|nr:MAG: DUF2520 domain-containing protein [Legionella sp.]